MSRARHHFKGAAALSLSQAATRVLSFLSLILIQKNTTVAENGLVQLGLRLGFLLSLFTEFGIRGYVVREIARCREDLGKAQSIFGNVFNLRLALVGPVWLAGSFILWAAGYSQATLVVVSLFYVFAVMDSFATLFKFLFRAYERMEFDAIFSVLGRGFLLIGLLILWYSRKLTVLSIAATHISASTLETFALAVCVILLLKLRLLYRWDTAGIFDALRHSIPFAVINIIGTLYMSTGTIALSKMLGEEAVGYYNAASRLPEALQFLPVAVVNALIPFLSRHHSDRELVSRYYEFLARYLGYFGVTVSAVFVFAPQWVIHFVAKQEYLVATPVFQFYGIWLILIFYQFISANILICVNAERIVMMRAMIALALNVCLNIIGIRIWGLNGAAMALVTTELVSAGLYSVALARRGIHLPAKSLLRIGVVGLAAALPLVFLNRLLPDTLRVAAGVLSGCVVAIFFALQDDRLLLMRILRRGQSSE